MRLPVRNPPSRRRQPNGLRRPRALALGPGRGGTLHPERCGYPFATRPRAAANRTDYADRGRWRWGQGEAGPCTRSGAATRSQPALAPPPTERITPTAGAGAGARARRDPAPGAVRLPVRNPPSRRRQPNGLRRPRALALGPGRGGTLHPERCGYPFATRPRARRQPNGLRRPRALALGPGRGGTLHPERCGYPFATRPRVDSIETGCKVAHRALPHRKASDGHDADEGSHQAGRGQGPPAGAGRQGRAHRRGGGRVLEADGRREGAGQPRGRPARRGRGRAGGSRYGFLRRGQGGSRVREAGRRVQHRGGARCRCVRAAGGRRYRRAPTGARPRRERHPVGAVRGQHDHGRRQPRGTGADHRPGVRVAAQPSDGS